jgi:hypothetical protein
MPNASSFNDPAGRELLAMLRNARRNNFSDPKYHSGRKKKEFASPYLEFLDKLEKLARKMPQPSSSICFTPTGSDTRTWMQA